jgi:hypothetical protein
MKIKFTFEYDDLLEQITKMLAMNGVKPLINDKGQPLVHFNHKKKEITVEAEAAPIPDACLFCGGGVQTQAPTEATIDDSKTQAASTETSTANEDEPKANTGEEEENVPMSMAALKAQSQAFASQDGPIKHDVQRGAEAHAALAGPSRLDGESEDPPFPGEGGA